MTVKKPKTYTLADGTVVEHVVEAPAPKHAFASMNGNTLVEVALVGKGKARLVLDADALRARDAVINQVMGTAPRSFVFHGPEAHVPLCICASGNTYTDTMAHRWDFVNALSAGDIAACPCLTGGAPVISPEHLDIVGYLGSEKALAQFEALGLTAPERRTLASYQVEFIDDLIAGVAEDEDGALLSAEVQPWVTLDEWRVDGNLLHRASVHGEGKKPSSHQYAQFVRSDALCECAR